MCGILFLLSYNHERAEVLEKSLLPLLLHRGPDGHHAYSTTNVYNTTSVDVPSNSIVQLRFHGTVLHLRGELTKQPLVSEDGHVLLWNGEIFGGDVEVPENANDTSVLFENLQRLPFQNEEEYCCQLLSIFGHIQGPWAFVFYDVLNMKLWYGRDYFGRRSLMSSYKDNTFCLSSLGHRRFPNEFTEVPAKILYCLDVNKLCKDDITNSIKVFPLKPFCRKRNSMLNNALVHHRCLDGKQCGNHTSVNNEHFQQQHGNNDNENNEQHHETDKEDTTHNSSVCSCKSKSKAESTTQRHIKQNVEPSEELSHDKSNLRTTNHVELLTDIKKCEPDIETKCCYCLNLYNETAPSLTLNHVTDPWLNVDLDQSLSTISDQGVSPCKSLRCNHSYKEKVLHSQCMDCNLPVMQPNNILSIESIGSQFLYVLEEAVHKRVNNIPRAHNEGIEGDGNASKVGILFSGGIDSAVLACLADRYTPLWESIDLINVAFAQKQKVQQNVKKKDQRPLDTELFNFDVPDRITGRTALKELLSNERQWNFIEVDVTLEQLQEERKSCITNLVYPLDSVLDDSIGCAIWFAARGIGRCYVLSADGEMQLTQEKYISPVKVLLTGMGADEQLGGYARHRTKFESSGWVGLQNEMKMEVERISTRNMGRDDRCISDHGREARFPFLDEDVVSFLQEIPVCVKCDPRQPRGFGEKILLREVALSIGLPYTSKLPKRAIQFGSKIAKLESSKEKGSDNCKRLENVQIL